MEADGCDRQVWRRLATGEGHDDDDDDYDNDDDDDDDDDDNDDDQELLAYQYLSLLHRVWAEERVPLYVRPYK